MVVEVPVPVMAPGLIVHVPVAGKPFKTTLPVALVHVGCVMVPKVGAEGVVGCAFTTTLKGPELHPLVLVTVKL